MKKTNNYLRATQYSHNKNTLGRYKHREKKSEREVEREIEREREREKEKKRKRDSDRERLGRKKIEVYCTPKGDGIIMIYVHKTRGFSKNLILSLKTYYGHI